MIFMRAVGCVIRKRRPEKGDEQAHTAQDVRKLTHVRRIALLVYGRGVHIEVSREFPNKIGESATASPLCDPCTTRSDLTFPRWNPAPITKKRSRPCDSVDDFSLPEPLPRLS